MAQHHLEELHKVLVVMAVVVMAAKHQLVEMEQPILVVALVAVDMMELLELAVMVVQA